LHADFVIYEYPIVTREGGFCPEKAGKILQAPVLPWKNLDFNQEIFNAPHQLFIVRPCNFIWRFPETCA
jgi:hypothetical protein